MTWFFASLMILALWLLLRPPKRRQLTTEEIVQKYKDIAEARNRKNQVEKQEVRGWHTGKGDVLHQTRDKKPSKAELRLSTYLFFDGKQAARLVDGVQARFPDKPRQWCAEKALSDLERDRQMR